MNVLDALYHTVHDYPGGAEALAVRLGKRGSSLSHEVRPPAGSSAKAGLVDTIKIMEFTGDHRTLHVMNAQLGYLALQLPQLDDLPEDAHAELALMAKEFAEVVQAVAVATADATITDNELSNIERQWGELVAAGTKLMGIFAAKNAAGKGGRA